MTGHRRQRLIILNMQYGINYSGPGYISSSLKSSYCSKDVLSEDRAIGDPSSADKRIFHPVLYYCKEPIESMLLILQGNYIT